MRRINWDVLVIGAVLVLATVIWLLPIPHSGEWALGVGLALLFLFSLGQVAWQLFKDFRAAARWIARQFKSKD